MALELDYSHIPPVKEKETRREWKPAARVYFGKKDPITGEMEDEPKYTHVEYPKVLYKLSADGLKLEVHPVSNEEEELAMLEAGAARLPSDFGVYTAPSTDQVRQMNADAAKAAKDTKKK